jgi:hypothetical protein
VADYGNDMGWRTGVSRMRPSVPGPVVEGHLLGPLRPPEPLVAWLLRQQTSADLRRLKQLLETPARSQSTPEEEETAP